MRNALMSWLCEKSQIDPAICFLTADLGYSVIESYEKKFPDRCFNIGVAEQNMTGIAAGLASEGRRVYTYSIGIFPTFRCAEQIRNDIDYHKLSVVNCAIGSGVAYGSLGYSHHAIQDLSIMRSLPNMTIATPSDPNEVLCILNWQYENPGPMYLRIHKAGEPSLLPSINKLYMGCLRQINPLYSTSSHGQSQSCILVIGFLAKRVLDYILSVSSDIPVYSVPLWGRSSRRVIAEQLRDYKSIVTIEDHVLEGGFGSFIMETAAIHQLSAQVIPLALQDDVIGQVAKEDTLLRPLMMNLAHVYETRLKRAK